MGEQRGRETREGGPRRSLTSAPVALVTGASSGIGKITATLFAEQGFRVFGTSRQSHPDQRGVEMLTLDVRVEASITRCLADVERRAARIDVLVNNAGVAHLGVAEETTIDEARRVLETNFFGVVRVTNAALPGMRRRRHGRIINVGSLAAWVGEPGEAFYSASKRALAGYTEALRHEVRPFGIHVSLIEPGAFKTGIMQGVSMADATIPDYDATRRAVQRTLRDSAHRGGDPHAVAELILRVARARSPRLRYGVGRGAHSIPYLRMLLPQRIFDYLVRRGFGLSKEGSEPIARPDKEERGHVE